MDHEGHSVHCTHCSTGFDCHSDLYNNIKVKGILLKRTNLAVSLNMNYQYRICIEP